MFGAHIFRNGKEDFTLYDMAFDAAQRHGVKIFATLFPTTDELRDVGGFKFPNSKAHLVEIDDYINTTAEIDTSKPSVLTAVVSTTTKEHLVFEYNSKNTTPENILLQQEFIQTFAEFLKTKKVECLNGEAFGSALILSAKAIKLLHLLYVI